MRWRREVKIDGVDGGAHYFLDVSCCSLLFLLSIFRSSHHARRIICASRNEVVRTFVVLFKEILQSIQFGHGVIVFRPSSLPPGGRLAWDRRG